MATMSEEAKAARREYNRRRREAMTPEQRQALREYHTQWQRNNPDKVKAITARYWEKQAEQLKQAAGGDNV